MPIRHLKSKSIRATLEHFEETIRHLQNAEKISRFASDDVIARLGDSKNVFFNSYLRRRKIKPQKYNFSDYLEELVGYESDGPSGIVFGGLLDSAYKVLSMSGVEIISKDDLHDQRLDDSVWHYRNYGAASRKHQTIKNDIIACEILSDEKLHVDENRVGQIPFLVTWDSTQHDMRNVFRQRNKKFAEWLIYSPQRAVERFSMVDLKIGSGALKDTVLAIIDEDYFNDSKNSLVDTLAIFLGEDQVESSAVVSLLTKLSRKITEEAGDSHNQDLDNYNVLNEVLIYTQSEFKSDFAQVRQLFSSDETSDAIFKLLSEVIGRSFDDAAKKSYVEKMTLLLKSTEAN